MSKRGAADYITRDGIGSMEGADGPPAQRATAAQLANRKIAAAKPRAGARRGHTPGASSGFTPSSGGFGASSQSQSFPPVNGSSSIGNGSASTSFGGFGSGSGGGGGGFNFSAGGGSGVAGFNNPFAQAANGGGAGGATSSSGGFNFGGSGSTGTSFQFGGQQPVQPPSTNMFGASLSQPGASSTATTPFGGFGSSSSQSQAATSNMFGASTSQAQPATPSFGGFGGSISTPATTASNAFGGSFGATAAPTQTPSTAFGGFGQSAATPSASTPAPSFGGFGQTATAPPPSAAFGQSNGDMALSTPESSPQKPLGWNKQTTNGIAGAEDKSGGESPDRPPHVEQEGEAPPNVFAGLKRGAPQPAPAPAPKSATNNLFNFGKPAEAPKTSEPQKQPTQEKENQRPSLFAPAKETPAAAAAAATTPASNPFASLKRMESTEKPSLFSSTQQTDQPKPAATPAFSFASTPQPAASPAAAATSLFQPKTSLSNFFSPNNEASPSESSPAPAPSKPVNLFAQASSAQPAKESPKPLWGAAASTAPSPAKSLFTSTEQAAPSTSLFASTPKTQPAPSTSSSSATAALPSSELLATFLPELMREDNLPAPDVQQDLNVEERKLWYRDLKIARLNKVWLHVLPTLTACGDLSPFMGDYAALMAKITEGTHDSRLGQLISSHGQLGGQRLYDQEQGRLPADGTNKRKAAPAEDQEKEKRTRLNGESSSTVNKFQSILGQGGEQQSPGTKSFFGGSTASPAPTKNLFGASATSSTSLFNASTPAASSTSSLFSKAAATPTNGGASGLFAKDTSAPSEAPATGGFKPTTTATTSASSGAPAFGFKPAGSSASSGLPKFGGASTGSFMTQFSQSAEETAKKTKQRAMDEDYDSDEETKEQWSARYDRELEEKKKKLATSSVSGGFKFTPTSSVAGSNAGSGDEAEPRGLSSFLAPPAAGSIFSGLSRSASPAGSATGSVFDAPRSSTPGVLSKDNPFASLSRQASEKGDADDEDEESADGDEQSTQYEGEDSGEQDEEEEATPKPNGVSKRRGPFEEDEDSQTETPVKQQRTDGLFGRVTRDGDRTPLASTGANASSLFSTSAPADQTWTPKDPIKFSTNNTSSEGETTTAKKPLFSFTPSTSNNTSAPKVFSGLFSGTQPSPAVSGTSTPNPFAGLSTPADKIKAAEALTVPPSGGTSLFTTTPALSRATTPGPSDMSGAESTAGEEETRPDTQIDIADMSADKKDAEVLFESSKVKATKYEKADPAADKKEGWNVVGVGPIAILKKDGVSTMLMRAHPSGKVIINTRLNAVLNPQVMKKRARVILVTSKGGAEPYLISFQSEEDCARFVEACKTNGAK